MTNEDPKPVETTTTTFAQAVKGADIVAQAYATRECKYPVTPRQITNEDWNHGIGLN